MLLDPYGNKLGDKRLSKEEALAKLKEETDKRLEQSRLRNQEEYKDFERRLGKGMLHTELYEKVRRLNPNIIMETSNNDPNVAGFYLATSEGKKFICAFHKGFMPEFSIIEVDERDRPKLERRGWRTVLLRLIQQHCLRKADVEQVFGRVFAQDERGRNWKIYTEGY